jgi:hypothetical protein
MNIIFNSIHFESNVAKINLAYFFIIKNDLDQLFVFFL